MLELILSPFKTQKMLKVSLENLPKTLKIIRGGGKKFAIIKFVNDEWRVHSDSEITQKMITDYLIKNQFDVETENIYHLGNFYTCFKIPTLEMILWLKNHKDIYPSIIFHKKKNVVRGFSILKDSSLVK